MRYPTRRAWIAVLLSLAAALSLLIAACGGDDDDNSGDNNSDGEPTATEPTSTGDGGGGDNGGDSSGGFGDLSSEWQNTNAKITYETTATSNGETTTTTMTIYNKPPKSRTDYTDTSSGETTTFIDDGETSYVCASNQCVSSPSQGSAANPIPFASLTSGEAISAYAGIAGIDTNNSSEDIAGKSAKCFKVSHGGTEIKWCFSKDGLLLLTSSKDANSEFVMKATEVSTDVSDSDFEPPYDVVDMSNPGG